MYSNKTLKTLLVTRPAGFVVDFPLPVAVSSHAPRHAPRHSPRHAPLTRHGPRHAPRVVLLPGGCGVLPIGAHELHRQHDDVPAQRQLASRAVAVTGSPVWEIPRAHDLKRSGLHCAAAQGQKTSSRSRTRSRRQSRSRSRSRRMKPRQTRRRRRRRRRRRDDEDADGASSRSSTLCASSFST